MFTSFPVNDHTDFVLCNGQFFFANITGKEIKVTLFPAIRFDKVDESLNFYQDDFNPGEPQKVDALHLAEEHDEVPHEPAAPRNPYLSREVPEWAKEDMKIVEDNLDKERAGGKAQLDRRGVIRILSKGKRQEETRELYAYPNFVEDARSFMQTHAPYALAWEFGEKDYTDALRMVAETYAHVTTEQADVLIRLNLLAFPVLKEAGAYDTCLNDMFYCDSNIDWAHDVFVQKDVRQACYYTFGCYSKPLGKRFISFLQSHRANAHEYVTLLKFAYGMSPEYIIKFIDCFEQYMFSDTMIFNGVPLCENKAYLPAWFKNLPDKKKLSFVQSREDIDTLFACLNLSAGEKIDEIKDTSSIEAVHVEIIERINQDNLARYEAQFNGVAQGGAHAGKNSEDEIDSFDKNTYGFFANFNAEFTLATQRGEFTMRAVNSPFEMTKVGLHMSICCGGQRYLRKLVNNKCVFLVGQQAEDTRASLFMQYDTEDGRLVEARYRYNKPLDNRDLENLSRIDKVVPTPKEMGIDTPKEHCASALASRPRGV